MPESDDKSSSPLTSGRGWSLYSQTYRATEMRILANWIERGKSGTVVGLPGSGKSNLLGYLCYHLDALPSYLSPHAPSTTLIPIDLNNLVENSLATFYRVILRSIYHVRSHFSDSLNQTVADLYQETKSVLDPFVSQSALYDFLLECRLQHRRLVFVIDRFDEFCQHATPAMTNTLRGLRDSFKESLCYIMGMRHEAVYMSDPGILGELYEILDSRVCWVGSMSEADARQMITQELYSTSGYPSEIEISTLFTLAGGYPSLLKIACSWWQQAGDKPIQDEWNNVLLKDRGMQHRLQEIWSGLSQEERLILADIQRIQDINNGSNYESALLNRLVEKGLCQKRETGWHIQSDLFAAYIPKALGRGLGRIWLDDQTDEMYQGQTILNALTPLEREVLRFLIRRPRVRHAKTELIVNAWPDELRRKGVSDDSLYQIISSLRKKIEPDSAHPCYIINWRGWPESGYQFFPEGRPG